MNWTDRTTRRAETISRGVIGGNEESEPETRVDRWIDHGGGVGLTP